ncbi:MAG TPA: radical SAM protein [Nitrospirota bacterium]|nr:radical SAM protein [Nitrospirota bacterium]
MYSPFRYVRDIFWKGRPIHLAFFITRRCNAKCPFCFYLRSGEPPADSLPELSLEEIERTSSSLGSLLWLAFSGGEIFLRDDLIEIARIFYRNNKPAIMLFPTNGLMPEVILDRIETIVRSCPKSVVALKLSVDGVGEAHDTIRNMPGSFDKTLQTYMAVSDLVDRYPNFELGINTVFCSENQESMDEVIDFVRELKNIKTHTISLVRGNLTDKRYGVVDSNKYLDAVRKLEENLKGGRSPVYRFRGARIKAAQDILQRRLIHQTMRENKRIIPCFAGRLNLVLTECGDVFPCELLTESFGNVRDFGYDIGKVVRSERACRVNGSIRDNTCYCTHECYFMTNILFNLQMYPTLMNEYLQLRTK